MPETSRRHRGDRDIDKPMPGHTAAIKALTYTHPDVLRAAQAGEPWADPIDDPRLINWPDRQRVALIPFHLADGRPVNPCGPTPVRYGRGELGHWGEQACADALVTATDPTGGRWAVMIERADGHGWALPGGYTDPGETPTHTAARELAEETHLHLPGVTWIATAPRYVPDPRASDEAWIVTVLCTTDLGTLTTLPPVTGGDDATRAAWLPADTYAVLAHELNDTYDGRVFGAHAGMLRQALQTPPAAT